MALAARIVACLIAAWVWIVGGAVLLARFFYYGGHLGGTRWLFIISMALLPLAILSFWRPRTAAICCWLVTVLYLFGRWSEIARLHGPVNRKVAFVFTRSGTWEFALIALLVTFAALARPPAAKATSSVARGA